MSACRFRVCVISALVLLGAARSSTAEPVVIYSNFGPAPGHLAGPPWTNGVNAWVQSEEAGYFMGFELTEAARLDSILLPWARASQNPGIGIELVSSSLSSIIESWRYDVEPAVIRGEEARFTLARSTLHPLLEANTTYFLRIYSLWPSTQLIWPWNNAGIEGTIRQAGLTNRTFTGPLSAFQIEGEPGAVPEPATLLLFASGAGLVLQRVRRRRV